DNDGDEDIVSGGALTIHQNLGGGSYSISIDICSDTREFDGFEVADINNDGWLDVVAFSIDRDLLSWFRNNGDLTFSAEIELYDEFNGLRAIDVADLDADGHLDLLIGTMLPDKVMWMRNYGLANFGAPINISTSNNDPSSIHTADMDGDGDPDVLVSSTTDNEISWYANNGTGTFATAQIVTNSATTIFEAFPADLDNDGDIDVLGTSYSADMAMWFANDGSGVFSAPVTLASASNAKFVTAADVNNDGDVDVFVGGGLFKYYIENLGAGTFSAAVQVGGDQSIWDYLAPGDMDGDGDLDLVTSTLKVHAFNGSTYAAGVSVFTEIGADYTHAYQLDGTGHLELLMGDGDFVYYFLNEENNEVFAETQTISTEIDGLAYAVAADINGDGLNDVITCSSNDQKLAWYAGDGNGNFGAQQVIDNSLDSPFYLDIADLDNDGDNDILLTTGLYELSADVAFYRNEGSGNFSAPTILASADYDIEFNLKDVNLDGLLDIVYFIGYAVDELFWVQNLGGGNFSPATELYTLTTITSGILVNMDADPDYEICTTTSAGLSIIDDTGGMNYTAPVATGSSANEILGSGDFDSDGDDDLLMTKPVTPEFDGAPYHILVWLENLGNGNVGPLRVVSNFGNFYNEFTFADVDADGDLDVVTRLMWIENTYLNGCTDPAACNYEAENYIDDGSCCYGVCGCINPQSPNYDPAATCDDLTCIIEGCMDVQSCNYDSDATFDDGSCEYLSCAGCMDP
ncbi:MAG: VCBS repeat-containing protein, partial [Flavobacteriales bacterium]|nr:VCBS repeat-containing protein [Flavobacteriales bacterium]